MLASAHNVAAVIAAVVGGAGVGFATGVRRERTRWERWIGKLPSKAPFRDHQTIPGPGRPGPHARF